MMRKILPFLIPLLLFTGCGGNAVPEIDAYTWEMTSVQSKEENGGAIAYGERGDSALEVAVQLDMTCTAKDGVLTVADNTNQTTYSGSYTLRSRDPESVIYDIMLEGREGIAVTGMTTYHDGAQEPTCIINLEEYAINFFAAEE